MMDERDRTRGALHRALGQQDRTRHGVRWDEASDGELRRLSAAGELLPAIARTLGRSQEAVRTRANLLHVPVRSSVRTRRSDAVHVEELAATE